ncbi:transposase [Desulfobacterota bacterium AH_259_B03_O07]|nr:transposase [Desulfobacterota bacterium AH_259_B03_O07]
MQHTGLKEYHFVMLAYNLMNLFKKLVLGQKDKKLIGKCIRQRLFFIAGKLIKSGRRFILKLLEDWAYKEEYKGAERRLGAIVWIT